MNMPTKLFSLAALVSAAVLSGCASNAARPSLDERYANELRPFEELKMQKAELWELGQEPQVFAVDGQGQATVRQWALQGWPGEEYIKARFTYENTTDKTFEHAIVWLEVLDSKGKVRGSSAVLLYNPLGYRIWPNHTNSTEIRAPTNGAHKDADGWFWRIDVKSLVTDDDSPRPERFLPSQEENRGFRMPARSNYIGPASVGYIGPASVGTVTPGVTQW